jgi:hypothetical protein
VTADGSIDCQEDPGEQESIVSSLHYCEAVSALYILAKGKYHVYLYPQTEVLWIGLCTICGYCNYDFSDWGENCVMITWSC